MAEPLERMRTLIAALHPEEGHTPTAIAGIGLLHARHVLPQMPVFSGPSLTIIACGEKISYVNDHRLRYGAGQYLMQALPLPFECETPAHHDEPLYAFTVALNPILLSRVLLPLDDIRPPCAIPTTTAPIMAGRMNKRMQENAIRLLECLHDPVLNTIVGQARLTELVLDVLQGEQGTIIQALLHHQSPFSRLTKALHYLHEHYANPISVELLAQQVNMSVSAFHHHFKRLFYTSPLQYLKQVRLIKAKQMLRQEHVSVSFAAERVGYRSFSQFSREYKRFFGTAPRDERQDHRLLISS